MTNVTNFQLMLHWYCIF